MTPPVGTVTTLSAMHAAILAALRARFGDRIARYGAYELSDEFSGEPDASVVTPALLLQLEDWSDEPIEGDPYGRLALRCSWAVHGILGFQTADLQATLPQLAAAVGSVVMPLGDSGYHARGNRWGLGCAVELPERVSGQPGEFRPGLHGADSWVCRWEQVIYLSEEAPL